MSPVATCPHHVMEAPRGKSYECLDAYDAARAEFAKVEGDER